jgi:NAD(P)-dependent dehydrogenase (short-subunit alcohol dehydrogenase family)
VTGLLAGRTIIVTGAGRGLGRAYARQCADAGATVVVNDLDPVTAAETVDGIIASGGAALACVGATNEPGFGDELVRAAIDAGGRVDGIVANAGIISPRSIFDETFENAARQIDVNVMGVIEPVMAAAKAMRAHRTEGSIVLITSGARCGVAGMPTYGASKGAVASLCWGWALECEPFGIRVNALSPVARTEMFPQPGDTTSDPFPPETIAPAVVYLLSDLSRSITGQILRFTGDVLGLHPAPIGMSASATRSEGWTVEDIATAMDHELAPGLAYVGLGPQLAVPLDRS